MKTKDPIGKLHLRHQLGHITLKKFQFFQEYGADPDNVKLVLILIRRREIQLKSDENKLLEVKVIY